MKTSESVKEIIPALSRVQYMIDGAKADSTNPRFKSKYTSIEAIMEAIKPALEDNKLMIMQDIESDKGVIAITTRLYHMSGEWVEFGPFKLFVDRETDPQSYGSCITYARKYSISAALGLVREPDDDGNAAVPKEKKQEPKMGSNEILMIETELVGLEDLKKEILEKSKVKELKDLEQRYFAGILSHIRAKKREATNEEE